MVGRRVVGAAEMPSKVLYDSIFLTFSHPKFLVVVLKCSPWPSVAMSSQSCTIAGQLFSMPEA